MYTKFKEILFFSLLASGFFTCNLKAMPMSCNIYAGVGGSYLDMHEAGVIKNNIGEVWSKKSHINSAINFSVGISSNIPLPVVKSLRFEVSYLKSLKSSQNNLKGVGVYYDFKNIPMISPYVGISLFHYNAKIRFNDNSEYIKQKTDQGLTSFNIGLSTLFPIFPLNLYGEYRYMIPGVFKNNLKINRERFIYSNSKCHVSNVILGIRYNFL